MTGQFLSVDPDFNATLDAYGYADDNPLDNVDPSGLRIDADPGVAGEEEAQAVEAAAKAGDEAEVTASLNNAQQTAATNVGKYTEEAQIYKTDAQSANAKAEEDGAACGKGNMKACTETRVDSEDVQWDLNLEGFATEYQRFWEWQFADASRPPVHQSWWQKTLTVAGALLTTVGFVTGIGGQPVMFLTPWVWPTMAVRSVRSQRQPTVSARSPSTREHSGRRLTSRAVSRTVTVSRA